MQNSNNLFDVLILIARPAAGKSEIIKYLAEKSPDTLKNEYHLGSLNILDDFPILWRWFEEDDLLTKMGLPRLYTDSEGYFLNKDFWNLLIQLLILDYEKLIRKNNDFHKNNSVIFEFSRGSEHGGFQEALQQFPKPILESAAIMYVDVSWEESLHKNKRRFNPENADSILEHSVPDEKLRRLYFESDWNVLIKNTPDVIEIHGVQVPYIIFDNMDDVTTTGGEMLAERIQTCFSRLWEIKQNIKY